MIEKRKESDDKLYRMAKGSKLEEIKIQGLVKNKNISERFGKYLKHLSNLIACMEMAEICTEYGRIEGKTIALTNAEHYLEKALAVYLSNDKRFGWTWDKMQDYVDNKLLVGHKELIDLAMEIKPDETGERAYLVKETCGSYN